MKTLRVYGYRSMRREPKSRHRMTRETVAVTSVAAAQRAFAAAGLFNVTYGDVKNYGGWTGNALELATALACPGVVFWRSDVHGAPFQRAVT